MTLRGLACFAVERPCRSLYVLRLASSARIMSATRRSELRVGLEGSLGRLWRYGVVLSGSDAIAEHLVRATCTRALEREDDLPLERELTWWLFSILRSIWLNYLSNQSFQAELPFSRSDVKANLLPTELRPLSPTEREALFLICGEQMRYREAAVLLGVPIEALKARLAAAREGLGSSTFSSAEESNSGTKR
jgi:RNA polymerase sigma-70 factor (ECF subfamily)